ncbi:radical SAM protein [Candidatus Bathyarchaeota archaeon]|nr:radical SAM protein [Candidatus Bathyarchaeota archaeon]NIU81542.1 radical SAM protein [Candidatus Bathyarchaeota archaeon]NIW34704.1 radical SAM protein [Candidatus Bathyarchaeota archaeon]
MQLDPVENALLSAVNPLLKSIVKRFDIECGQDGSLLQNSLKHFLGQDVQFCRSCTSLSRKIADPFYHLGSRILRVDKAFMRNMFLEQEYCTAWLKGFALMMKGIRKYGIRIPFTPAAPFQIVWDFTYLCNLRCKHCYANAGTRLPELTTDEAYHALDVLSRVAGVGLPSLSFSGGEPLVRKDFFEVAAYAKRRIPYISVATNGTLLTEENVERLKDIGMDYVEISLDGASKEVHEDFRRVPGCFKQTINGIENCIDADLDTCIAATAHRDNLREIPKMIELAEELGTRFIHFNYIPTGRAKEHMELDLTPEQRLSLLEMIGKKVVRLYLKAKEEEEKKGRTNVKSDRFFSTCPQFASVVKRLSAEMGEDFAVSAHYAAKKGVENVANFLGGCGAGRLYMALEPNGDLKPCVFFPTNRKTVLGNILEDDFESLWDNKSLLWELRSRENLETYRLSDETLGCGSCEEKYICGGCRARSYGYFNGRLTAADIGCIHNEKIWENVKEPLQG